MTEAQGLAVADPSKLVNFFDIHAVFIDALEEAIANNDVQILRRAYDSFSDTSDQDKKTPMDQAFRDFLLFRINSDVEKVAKTVKLSVDAVRIEIVSLMIPVVLLGDIFDAVTLDKCEQIFCFVEDMVGVWKEELFFSTCKNNILRICNDLLRRLSRAQNTVFCGRILLFLAKFFPFSERSGLNIISEFNLDNVTEYGVDGKDLDDALEDGTEENLPVKVDYHLYCKFWSLQDFFRNPNQCYSKAQWKMFQTHTGTVLDAFSSLKLEMPNLSGASSSKSNGNVISNQMDTDMSKQAQKNKKDQSICKAENFFAKFLTNPKLLSLQLSDSNFRRSVLVQFLILFQYLQLTVKFKHEASTLTPSQDDFIKETEAKVYQLLEETPPNGKRFARTVQHMLTREEMWNNWKNDGCKEFKKQDDPDSDSEMQKTAKRPRKCLGDSLREANRSGKFYLGNDVLTRLWNYSPDNLQACKSEERNFLPQVDAFIENPPEKSDPSYEWRALRLLARQSLHFFTFLNTSSYDISEYLNNVRRKIAKDKADLAKLSQSEPLLDPNSGADINDVETVALQENTDLVDEEVLGDSDKIDDDKNAHDKPMAATKEQIEEIAPLIGEDWKKLGKKLGYKPDELLFFSSLSEDRDAGCINMLINWFADDDDASLDNWAYMLEGLEINTAAKAVKALIDRLLVQDNKSVVEVVSD